MSDEDCKVTHWGDGEGEIINYFGMMAVFKVRSHQTGGTFSVMEFHVPPPPPEP